VSSNQPDLDKHPPKRDDVCMTPGASEHIGRNRQKLRLIFAEAGLLGLVAAVLK